MNSNLIFFCLCHQQCISSTDGTIYNYQARTLNGSHTVNLGDFRGRSVLFVNVATYWGYTYQYVGKKITPHVIPAAESIHLSWSLFFHLELNALHEEMKLLGLTILAFPSNQFGKQEPGDKHEILPALKWAMVSFHLVTVVSKIRFSLTNNCKVKSLITDETWTKFVFEYYGTTFNLLQHETFPRCRKVISGRSLSLNESFNK